MPQRVVLHDELRCDRRGEAQREGSRPVELLIREFANGYGGLPTVLPQEFERGGLRDPRLIAGMLGVHLGDSLPRDTRHGLAAGDCSRQINLNRVDTGNMVDDDAERTAVSPTTRDRGTPLRFGESFRKGG